MSQSVVQSNSILNHHQLDGDDYIQVRNDGSERKDDRVDRQVERHSSESDTIAHEDELHDEDADPSRNQGAIEMNEGVGYDREEQERGISLTHHSV